MKRFKQISTVLVVALLAVGCNREDTPGTAPSGTVRNVSYIACGERNQETVTGDAGWNTLMNRLFDAVDDGCKVTFWNPDSVGSGQQTADESTYRTSLRDSAFAWSKRMYDQGFTVSASGDPVEHVYIGYAVKTSPMPPSDYTPLPLEQYLPGTWVLDGTVLASHYYGYWELEYDSTNFYDYNDTLIFTDTTVYTSVMGGSIGPYIILDTNTIQMQLPLYQEWWMYEFSQRSIIFQLDENRMLIHGYLPNSSFFAFIYQEDLDDFTFLFIRQ